MRETSANEPLKTHRKGINGIKTGELLCPGRSMADTYLPVMRWPVYRRRESHLGFRTELENLAGDGKGKGSSGRTVRPKVPRRWPGADCPVSSGVIPVEPRGQVTGVGIDRSTGNGRNRLVLAEGGSLHSVARAG